MKIHDATVLVTGANRGLGAAFTRMLLDAGARRVYAGARDPSRVATPGAVPFRLDVTRPDEVAAAARELADVTLLINNAGIARGTGLLAGADTLASLRAELEVNVMGTLSMSQAFGPVLKANGGGAIVNVLSVMSWMAPPGSGTYPLTKAAAWSLTNGLRNELRSQGTQVLAVHVAFVDTDMVRGYAGPKADPAEVARRTLQALEDGEAELLADDTSVKVKRGLALSPPRYA